MSEPVSTTRLSATAYRLERHLRGKDLIDAARSFSLRNNLGALFGSSRFVADDTYEVMAPDSTQAYDCNLELEMAGETPDGLVFWLEIRAGTTNADNEQLWAKYSYGTFFVVTSVEAASCLTWQQEEYIGGVKSAFGRFLAAACKAPNLQEFLNSFLASSPEPAAR